MITPIEIQNKSFKSGGLGYDKKDVDQFMRYILESYEILYRENNELKDKVSTLNENVQYYKTIEKTLQKALVLAEKTAEDTKEAALRDAKRIEREAQLKYELILGDAQKELFETNKKIIALVQQYEVFKAQMKSIASAQIEILESEASKIDVSSIEKMLDNIADLREKNTVNRAHSEDFWNKPLENIDRYLDNESDTKSKKETIEGQEEFSFISLEDEA